jgi:membrane protease YdiL (CAAX protease family)
MQQAPEDPWLEAFIVTLLLASLATWISLISRKLRRGWILPYEPRRPVPWGPVGALLAVVFVCFALLSRMATNRDPEPLPGLPNPIQTAENLVGGIFLELILVGSALAVIAVVSGADLRDLGLPVFADEFVRDVRIGVVAWLAVLAPVIGIQFLIMMLLAEPEKIERNPLIEIVSRERHLGVMLLATVLAVIVAPLCEEFSFRSLLQGWLEKWEDQQLGWRQPQNTVSPTPSAPPEEQALASEVAKNEAVASPLVSVDPLLPINPPNVGVAGLPYGLLPILVSSLLFGIAHFGYGFDPVPLFVYGLIPGYVYQRTHRIIPCIVTHGLFNLTMMLALWRMLQLGLE